MNFGKLLVRSAALLCAAVAFSEAASASDARITISTKEVCRAMAAQEERMRGMPDSLLQALSLAESGRRDDATRQMVAWPWTVMAEGEGRYYPTKQDAVNAVRQLKARGIRNIDVGCMQINLLHHSDAFASIETAFEPQTNVAYGAAYLSALHRETRSWFTAVKRYHSAKPKFHLPYRGRVFRIWRNIKRRTLAARELTDEITAQSDDSESMSVDIAFSPGENAKIMRSEFTATRPAHQRLAFEKAQQALAAYNRRMVDLRPR